MKTNMVKMKKGLFSGPHQGKAKPVASKDVQLGSGARPKTKYLEFTSYLESQPLVMNVDVKKTARSEDSGML